MKDLAAAGEKVVAGKRGVENGGWGGGGRRVKAGEGGVTCGVFVDGPGSSWREGGGR